MPKKYKPPKCPHCDKPLKQVLENEYNAYDFDPETGEYSENYPFGESSLEAICPYCNETMKFTFSEGVCNYQAQKNE